MLVICLLSSLGEPVRLSRFPFKDFAGSSDSKVSAYNGGDPGLMPGSGRSPGEGNGNPATKPTGGLWESKIIELL